MPSLMAVILIHDLSSQAHTQVRYRHGVDFLEANRLAAQMSYCGNKVLPLLSGILLDGFVNGFIGQ